MSTLTFVAVAALVAAGCSTIPSVSILLITCGVGSIILSVILDTASQPTTTTIIIVRVHITPRSGNAKTGPIPVTTTERASVMSTIMPVHQRWLLRQVRASRLALAEGQRWRAWYRLAGSLRLRPVLPEHQLWRHNQAGDLPHLAGLIDYAKIAHLVAANTGKRGFTYTHHSLNAHNVSILSRANRQGFTVNVSTESLDRADDALAMGLPAVAVVRNDTPVPERTPAGNLVVVCPAQTREVSCSECGLCSQAQRTCVVAFLAHGTQAKKVNAAVSSS